MSESKKDPTAEPLTQMGCVKCGGSPQCACSKCSAPLCYDCLSAHEKKHLDLRSEQEKQKDREKAMALIILGEKPSNDSN